MAQLRHWMSREQERPPAKKSSFLFLTHPKQCSPDVLSVLGRSLDGSYVGSALPTPTLYFPANCWSSSRPQLKGHFCRKTPPQPSPSQDLVILPHIPGTQSLGSLQPSFYACDCLVSPLTLIHCHQPCNSLRDIAGI